MLRIGCPDKACKRLAWRPLVIGFICIGRMEKATDHVVPEANDLRLCFKQKAVLDSWHLNRRDMLILRGLLDKAIREADDAVRYAEPTGEH